MKAVRALANKYPYDKFEDETANLTLLSGADKGMMSWKMRFMSGSTSAGIQIIEARISHLAYSPEIAGAMLSVNKPLPLLQLVKNRWRAVGMVDLALEK